MFPQHHRRTECLGERAHWFVVVVVARRCFFRYFFFIRFWFSREWCQFTNSGHWMPLQFIIGHGNRLREANSAYRHIPDYISQQPKRTIGGEWSSYRLFRISKYVNANQFIFQSTANFSVDSNKFVGGRRKTAADIVVPGNSTLTTGSETAQCYAEHYRWLIHCVAGDC